MQTKLDKLMKNWKKLKRLHPVLIELERIALIGEMDSKDLVNPDKLHDLILELGLNDDGLEEFPVELHQYCGQGMRIWQYPSQFSEYLVDLSSLKIRSYMELGVRHGGTFVTTVEYLARFHPLEFAVGVDIMPCPTINAYRELNPIASFRRLNTQSDEFQCFMRTMDTIDLVLIDANHFEKECRKEFQSVKDRAGIIVLHDINNIDFPTIATIWKEIKEMEGYTCKEYLHQYEGIGPYMGMGMAISTSRSPGIEALRGGNDDK